MSDLEKWCRLFWSSKYGKMICLYVCIYLSMYIYIYSEQNEEMERAKRRHIHKCVKECSAEQIMNRLFKIFWDTVKEDPDYVCTCCHRLMYRKTVVEFQRSKYKERLQEIVGLSLRRRVKQKVWICITCHRSLKQGRLPARAKANNLELEDIPA